MERTVSEMMSVQPVCIAAGAPIGEAHKLMGERDVRHLPVVEEGKLVGVVSERDLLRLEAAVDVDRKRDPVRNAMSSPAFWVLPETPVPVVARQMRDRAIGSAVVMQGERVVGIFTVSDGLELLAAPRRSRR